MLSKRESFSQSAKSGKILTVKCNSCGEIHLAMVRFCAKCGSSGFSEMTLAGMGKVETYTIITVAPDGFAQHTPYAWVVMALDDSCLRVSGFMGGVASPEDLPIGTRIKVTGHDERGVIMERA